MDKPKALFVDLIASSGHINFNRHILGCANSLFDITLATTPDYAAHFPQANSLYSLPSGIPLKSKGRVFHRFNQFLRWMKLRPLLEYAQFSPIFILGYEPVSAALFCPRSAAVWSIEHNTLDQVDQSHWKARCFKGLPSSWSHLVFFEYMGEFLATTFGRQFSTLPHPLIEDSGNSDGLPAGFPKGKKVIFSPSGSNDNQVLNAIAEELAGHPEFVFASKLSYSSKNEQVLSLPYFEDYAGWLRNAHAVYFSGNFQFRASGVVFDSLSVGTPVILQDSLFARNISQQYPEAVKIVENPGELFSVVFDREKVAMECSKLRLANSKDKIIQSLAGCLDSPIP
jgi:hypothetical protein